MPTTFCWFMMVAKEVREKSLVHWSMAESWKKRHLAVNPLQRPGLIYTSSTINNDKKQPDSSLSALTETWITSGLEDDRSTGETFCTGSLSANLQQKGCPVLIPSMTPSHVSDAPGFLHSHFSFPAQWKWRHSLNCSRLRPSEVLKCWFCNEVQGSLQFLLGTRSRLWLCPQSSNMSQTLKAGVCTPLDTSSTVKSKLRATCCVLALAASFRQIALIVRTCAYWFNSPGQKCFQSVSVPPISSFPVFSSIILVSGKSSPSASSK